MLLAGYPLVFAISPFRALFLMLLLCGTAAGMALAYVSVWASDTFGIGPQAVAMLFVVSGLTGAIVNPLLGLFSDRYGWRRGLIVVQLAVISAAYLGFTQAGSYNMAMVLVALSGLGIMGLALAMVNDLLATMPDIESCNAARILAAERTGWSIGIILGPAAAAAIVTATGGTGPVFVAAAAVQVVAGTLVFTLRPAVGARRRDAKPNPGAESITPARRLGKVALATLVLGLVLIMLPSQTRNMYLPLFVTQVLGEAAGTVGPLFTLNAMVAVSTMPYVGAIADRFGAQRVLYLGAIVGAAYCLLQAQASSYGQTLAIQTLVGFGIALWSTSALIYLQRLMPSRAGMAGGLYVATQQFTPVLSGLLLGPLAEAYGIPSAFAATGVLSLVAVAFVAVGHRIVAAPQAQ